MHISLSLSNSLPPCPTPRSSQSAELSSLCCTTASHGLLHASSAHLSIPASQLIPLSTQTRVHTSAPSLYAAIPALQIGSPVPFFWIAHIYILTYDICCFFKPFKTYREFLLAFDLITALQGGQDRHNFSLQKDKCMGELR